MNRILVAVFLSLSTIPALSQKRDTAQAMQQQDTIFQLGDGAFPVSDALIAEPREPKSPTRALMYALVLPGLGQAYNGKYWKIPIVWGALGAAGYAISYNSGMYREAMLYYIQDESDNNERIVRGWKRNMELSYIAAILVYGLQMLDAYVDANLYSWDVNNNLSLGISPSLQPMMSHTSLTGYSGGLTCSLKIKGR